MKSRRKASVKKAARRSPAAASDPPLSAKEKARVRASIQNIREGKFKDFSSVDQIWEYAESEAKAST